MAINGVIIALVEMVLIFKLEGKRNILQYITLGVFMVGISFLMLNLPGASVAVAISMIVMVTFGEILSMPFMNSYWITRTQLSNRGQYAALYTMAWSAAQTLGPMGGAQIAEHAGFHFITFANHDKDEMGSDFDDYFFQSVLPAKRNINP